MWLMLSDPLAQRVTWTLLHFIWQGAAIAAVLAILLRTRWGLTPQRRYAASVAALVLMALGGLFTCIGNDECRNPNVERKPVAEIRMTKQPPSTLSDLDIRHSFGMRISAFVIGSQLSVRHRLASLQPYLLIGWTLGILLLGGRLFFGYLGTFWLRGQRTALPDPVALRVNELSRSLGMMTAGVYASPRVREALAVGFWRPIVLVPLAWLTELPADVLEAIIAHELAHIRRWDRWVVLFQRVMETLLFYHPAVWWVSRTISFERELCCDELAVAATGRRLVYARALEAVGRQSAADLSLIFATSFQGEPDMKLLARVRNVLGLSRRREASIAWPAGLLALTVGVSLSLWSLSSALAADEPPEKTKVAREAEREKVKKSSPEAEAAKRKSAEAEKAGSSRDEAVQRKLREAKLKAAEAERAKLSEEEEVLHRKLREAKLKAVEAANARSFEEEAILRKLRELKERAAQVEREAVAKQKLLEETKAAEKAKSDYKATAKNYFDKQKEAANKYGELSARKQETKALEGFKPETDREAALFKLIQALHQEVAELRQEVNQMREAPHIHKKQVPVQEETIKQPARDGDAPKKAARDGEVIKNGPPDAAPR